jgi:hypothetical protein
MKEFSMKKNIVFAFFKIIAIGAVIGMAILAPGKVSAQDTTAFAADAQNRDQWVLYEMEKYPYYLILYGDDTLDKTAGVIMQTPYVRTIGGARYMVEVKEGYMVVYFTTARGPKAVMLVFDKKPDGEYFAGYMRDNSYVGPFNAGTTDASRKAALQRILDGVKGYRESPTATIPKE